MRERSGEPGLRIRICDSSVAITRPTLSQGPYVFLRMGRRDTRLRWEWRRRPGMAPAGLRDPSRQAAATYDFAARFPLRSAPCQPGATDAPDAYTATPIP